MRMVSRWVVGGLLLYATHFTIAFAEDAPAAAASHAQSEETIQLGSTPENLQTAYSAELSAHMKYMAFAAKADEEGYHQVASMFRAIARGEQVHASLLEELAGKTGITLAANGTAGDVLTTQENLAAALRDQAREKDNMYPLFIEQAKRDRNKKAAQTFRLILDSEQTHHQWYEQVLRNLDGYTAREARFNVCTGCGCVKRSVKDACSHCGTSRNEHEIVS